MSSIAQLVPALMRHLAEPAARAIVLACAVALALAVLRVRSASMRLTVWTGVLYAALAMPLLAWLLPAIPLRLPVLPASLALRPAAAPSAVTRPAAPEPATTFASSTAGNSARSAGSFHLAAARATVTPVPRARHAMESALAPTPHSDAATLPSVLARLPMLALALYLAVLAVLAGRLAVGLVLSYRLRRGAVRVDDRRARRWLEWHSLAMGVGRAPELAESAAVSVPLTLGVLRPVILLPASWREWETAKLSAVIAHEVSHVHRKDSLSRALALAYRSVFWFSPLGWYLERHLAELAEQASDEAAIVAGTEPTYYAEVLMSFIGTLQGGRGRVNWQGISMARGVRVRSRIERVLASGAGIPGRIKGSLLALIVLCGAPVVILTAATRPLLVSPAPAAAIAAPAQSAEAPPAPPAQAAAPALAPAVPLAPPARASTPSPAPAPAAVAGPLPPSATPVAGPVLPAPPGAPLTPAVAGTPPPPVSPAPPPPGGIGGHVASAPPPAPRAPAAPRARAAYGIPAPPPPPPASAARYFAYAQTPEARVVPDDEDSDWTFNGSREGMDFAIVSGKSVIANGSWDDRDEVKSLQRKISGDFIWFIHNGNSFVIRDAATVKAAQQLYAPEEELGRKQAALGKQQEELGRQQEELGKQQEGVRVKVPGDLAERLQKVEAEIRALGPTASQEDLGRLQGKLGDIEGELGSIQGTAGDEQGRLGEQQGELGEKQGELGRQQGELGREQGRIAREAAHQMQAMLKQALDNGKAQRAPE